MHDFYDVDDIYSSPMDEKHTIQYLDIVTRIILVCATGYVIGLLSEVAYKVAEIKEIMSGRCRTPYITPEKSDSNPEVLDSEEDEPIRW